MRCDCSLRPTQGLSWRIAQLFRCKSMEFLMEDVAFDRRVIQPTPVIGAVERHTAASLRMAGPAVLPGKTARHLCPPSPHRHTEVTRRNFQ